MPDEPNAWPLEPIECDDGHLKDAKGNLLISPDCVVEQATGDRLTACYNACRNISQEVLERVAKGSGFGHILIDLMAQKGIEPEGYFKQQFPNDNEEPRDATD